MPYILQPINYSAVPSPHTLAENSEADKIFNCRRLMYGPMGSRNYTYSYNTHGAIVDNQGYSLFTLFSHAAAGLSAWTPIPELNRTDSDVSLFILAPNSIRYEAPVKDPFFSANLPFDLGEGETLYVADHYLDVMACTEQH